MGSDRLIDEIKPSLLRQRSWPGSFGGSDSYAVGETTPPQRGEGGGEPRPNPDRPDLPAAGGDGSASESLSKGTSL